MEFCFLFLFLFLIKGQANKQQAVKFRHRDRKAGGPPFYFRWIAGPALIPQLSFFFLMTI